MRQLMARLSEEARTVLVLFEFEGMRGEEIAEILQCSVQTVWTRLHRARRRLAQEYEREERGGN
jgi:RNA polymerase sigma-70 factor (ECF subfamily)